MINKLLKILIVLSKGYWGIKTGITPTAGPCLAAYISKKRRSFLVILLNSRTMDSRWVEGSFHYDNINIVMKVVEHWQREISFKNNREELSLVEKQCYPLTQFNQKKFRAPLKKLILKDLKLSKPKFPDIDSKSEDAFLPSINTRDTF